MGAEDNIIDDGLTDEQIAAAIAENNNARIAALNQIGDGNDVRRKDEFEPDPDLIADPNPEPDPDPDPSPEPAPSPQLYTIKVNGVTKEVTLDELVATAQKVEAADAYLAEAARLRNQAVAPPADAPNPQEEDLALVRAIQMGNEDEALQAIRKLKNSGPSADDLTRTIDERLTFNQALAKFQTEYSDIISDPYLNQLALDADARLLAQGDKRPYAERFDSIGRDIRAWTAKLKGTTVDTKQARKEAAPSVPKAAAGKSVSDADDEKEETLSETIANIAKARGGPQWMMGSQR